MSLRRSTACARACRLLATKWVRISTSTGATFPTKTQHALRRKGLCVTESISSSRSRIRRREQRRPPPRKFPVVMLHVTAPVENGFIKSFAHPGGNITGFAGLGDNPAKELELFKELVPGLKRLLVLFDTGDPASRRWLADVRQAAIKLKLELIERQTAQRAEVKRVFSTIKPGDVDGVFVSSPELRTKFPSLILGLTADRHLPFLGHRREWVQQGALFSYNLDLRSVGKAAARYVDKILKGTKPADLPVEQSSQLQLIINLKTAKALGLTIPQSLLVRADEIIQ